MGRMEEPQAVAEEVQELLDRRQTFKGKKILITAGPTRVFLDSVRFFGNSSTGKMGFSFERAALQHGAEVILVSGPTEVPLPYGVHLVRVTSAAEMFEAVKKHF